MKQSVELRSLLVQCERFLGPELDKACALFVNALTTGRQLVTCGNGGSADEASHLVTEVGVRYAVHSGRPPLPAHSLPSNAGAFSAAANDFGLDQSFSVLLSGVAKSGDLLVAFTTSGASANVIQALIKARKMGLRTIAVTGARGIVSHEAQVDALVSVPSLITARVQEVHRLITHVLCDALEAEWK